MLLVQEKKKLTLHINAQLLEQAKAYATRNHISVSELVEAFFHAMIQKEKVVGTTDSPILQQLTGILPPDIDAKQIYGDYLMEKYG